MPPRSFTSRGTTYHEGDEILFSPGSTTRVNRVRAIVCIERDQVYFLCIDRDNYVQGSGPHDIDSARAMEMNGDPHTIYGEWSAGRIERDGHIYLADASNLALVNSHAGSNPYVQPNRIVWGARKDIIKL
jgi:hypothetical protein